MWHRLCDKAFTNKLHAIQSSLGRWPLSMHTVHREDEHIIFARISLGYTHLTHDYLLKRKDPPECDRDRVV